MLEGECVRGRRFWVHGPLIWRCVGWGGAVGRGERCNAIKLLDK